MSASLALLARLLLASIFLISGVRKILGFAAVSGMMGAKGFPSADVVLVLTIALEIGGGLMLVANWNATWAALALAAFTLAAGVIFHGFWNFWGAPPAEYNSQLNHFLKNIAIIGGLLHVAAVSSEKTRA